MVGLYVLRDNDTRTTITYAHIVLIAKHTDKTGFANSLSGKYIRYTVFNKQGRQIYKYNLPDNLMLLRSTL